MKFQLPNSFFRLTRILGSAGLCVLFAACASPTLERKAADIPIGSRYEPANLFAVSELPDDFTRVAVLPVHLPKDSVAVEGEISTVLLSELRRIRRFEVIEVSPETLFNITGAYQLSTLGAFPPELVEFLQTRLNADGVIQNDVTTFRPYRPFEVGIRSRLFDLRNREPLWAVDEVLNAGSKEVHTGLRHYSLGNYHEKYPYRDSYSAMRSPSRFTAYAAHTLYQTIPGFAMSELPEAF